MNLAFIITSTTHSILPHMQGVITIPTVWNSQKKFAQHGHLLSHPQSGETSLEPSLSRIEALLIFKDTLMLAKETPRYTRRKTQNHALWGEPSYNPLRTEPL